MASRNLHVLMYAAETWTFRKKDTNRLRAFEMKWLRNTEDIEYKVARENQEQGRYEKNGYKDQNCAKNDREKAQLTRPHMQNADKTSSLWHNGREKQERKT